MADEKKFRSIARTVFTKTAKELEQLLKVTAPDLTALTVTWTLLNEKYENLKSADREVWEKLRLQKDADEETFVTEISKVDEYAVTYLKLEQLYSQKVGTKDDVASVSGSTSIQSEISRKLKLPLIEFKKFGGDIREWLPFWSQFQKIHTDETIPLEDKFQYLVQTTVIGSRARAVVESFPPTRENYQKAIESLQARFGRDELLVEVYVRELLKMVLQNTLSKGKYDLTSLYDKLETQLRALESLGVTSDKCAAMLFPLVESCLPEDLLRAWQRSSNVVDENEDIDKLQQVMKFLKKEVESEERIALAREGFGFSSVENKTRNQKVKYQDSSIPTATGLINNETIGCIFCGNRSHSSVDCFKAQKMTVEERRKVLSKQKACFSCLKPGHQSSKCRERLRCLVCTEKHVILMCPNLRSEKNNQTSELSSAVTTTAVATTGEVNLANHTEIPVFLPTLRLKLRSSTKEKEVRAIIDTGSQRTYILKSTVQFMGYPTKGNERLIHALFGGVSTSQEHHKCYEIKVASIDETYSCTMEALDQKVICNNVPLISQGPWIQELDKLGISLSDSSGVDQIELLIGADVAGLLFTGRKHSLECGLAAVHTSLGWTVMGKVDSKANAQTGSRTFVSLLNKDMSVTELWKLETIGITDPVERKTKEQANIEVHEFFQQTISTDEDQRYEVSLPWVDGHPPLPRNEDLAMNRLKRTMTKLKGEKCYEEYKQVLTTWLQEGIIEEVPLEEISKVAHYLPHRAVVKTSSLTTKVRPVFDASAHEKNMPSLNDCLETGENLIELIPQILIKFRLFRYALSADICKAFLQIGISKEDREFLRFLWMNEDGKILHLRHKRVVFGLCVSPFLLGATIKHHLERMRELYQMEDNTMMVKIVDLLMNSFYVDNCLLSVSTKEGAYIFREAASQIMMAGKFDLRCWEITQEDEKETQPSPVLGIQWDRGYDTLCINPIQISEDILKISKREILSLAQRIYDPVGYLCPALLTPKLLLQRLWDSKISWDEEVPTDVRKEFLHWRSEVNLFHTIKIPRWINGTPGEEKQWSLHTFVDASQEAYAAAVFLRIKTEESVHVHLLQAKTRVSPLKRLTIPRLELLAATIGARLYDNVKRALGVSDLKSYFWSDSSTVCAWIQCEEQWGTFVWNRVVEIRMLTSKEDWRHISGTLNPADLPSRGCTPRRLLESRWWEGPVWLRQNPELWPTSTVSSDKEEVNSERKKVAVSMTTISAEEVARFYAYFSCYNKLVRMIAWLHRFLNNCNVRHEKKRGELSSAEFQHAEISLIRLVQQEMFHAENKQLGTLDTFMDESGIIRLKTRISCRNDTTDFLYPIVLPAHHPVVTRLIRRHHIQNCHAGVQTLMMLLREKFWILGGRKPVKTVIKSCITCRRHSAQAVQASTPPLPMNRVNDAKLFEVVGIDFAGPVYLKNKKKAWICLYTCAVYRAVHLELVTSLSTHCFLQSFRRFITRRGRPKVVYSDNGTNFVGAKGVFATVDYASIQQYCSVRQIEWYLNPPSAAWWGGWWERLIGLLKNLLRRVLGRACLDYEEFATILCECESIMNNRPLTYVSNDSSDLLPITPAMFMRDLTSDKTPDFDVIDSINFGERARHLEKVRADLRARFRGEYLGLLKQVTCRKNNLPIGLNDLVFIGNDTSKRLAWPLGRVIELLPGKDGVTRVVRVQTAKGVLLRPIQRLYPLEGSSAEVPAPEQKKTTSPLQPVQVDSSVAGASDKCSDSESRACSDSESRACSDSESRAYTTKSGRVVKVPGRFKDH